MAVSLSRAIILRTWDYGESDLLVSFVTRDDGRMKGFAKGARRSKKRFSNCLDLFCTASLEYEERKRSELYLIHSCRLLEGHSRLRTDFSLLCLASYMIELVEELLPAGEADPEIFDLLEGSLDAIDKGISTGTLKVFFEARAMSLGGYRISLDQCCCCGRSYMGQGRALFDRSRGAIACMGCRKESADMPGLGPESAEILVRMSEGSFKLDGSSPVSDLCLNELRAVLAAHMEYRLGKKLKTSRFF